MKTLELDFIYDPGHGWLKVPTKIIDEWDLASKISGYSYEHGEFCYLEEDRDAGIFTSTAEAKGVELKVKEIYQDPTPIRNYKSYC